MQRRVVEDSAKRMQALFQQLAQKELPLVVLEVLQQMCDAIGRKELDAAQQHVMRMMTTHFSDVGAWILAVKRLVEIAKTCLH